MADIIKGKSPFYPGQPVPKELFTGRASEIDHIVKRGARQVSLGKPVTMFVQGEYGIGKSSIASYSQFLSKEVCALHPIYVTCGGIKDLTGLAEAIITAVIKSGALDPSKSETIRNWLAKYVGNQQLFGFSINLEALKKDAPSINNPDNMHSFLMEAYKRLSTTGSKGLLLVLDEINGIASNPDFSHFIKGFVDINGVSVNQIPMMLMLCGTEDRRIEMIRNHQPIDRIFDVITITPLGSDEVKNFFIESFKSANMTADKDAIEILTKYSAGFPKIMHLIGNSAYFYDKDGNVDKRDATFAVFHAADEVGKLFVEPNVLSAIKSIDYRSILTKIGALDHYDMTFRKTQIERNLTDSEKKKFGNFIQKMIKLDVLKLGDTQGTYEFKSRMVRLYLWLNNEALSSEAASLS